MVGRCGSTLTEPRCNPFQALEEPGLTPFCGLQFQIHVKQISPPKTVQASQISHYEEHGFFFPIRVFDKSEAAQFRGHYLEFTSTHKERLKQLPPREQHVVLSMTAFS